MMQIPGGYAGRGRVQGSAWRSPDQLKADEEKKTQQDEANTVPFEEFRSSNGKITIFRQLPFSAATHKKANAYIELYKDKVEKVIIYFEKRSTCNQFCDLVRRQILDAAFKQYDLELFLADDDGKFDDKNEPPPSNETLARIIDIGLDSFYFKITNSWQLSQEDRANLVNKINAHKQALPVYPDSIAEGDDDDDSDSDSEKAEDEQLQDNDDANGSQDDIKNVDTKAAAAANKSDAKSTESAANAAQRGGCCVIL